MITGITPLIVFGVGGGTLGECATSAHSRMSRRVSSGPFSRQASAASRRR